MKKLFYITQQRLPTERAHGLQVMHMCDAFAKNDYEVALFVPDRKTEHQDDPFLFYNVDHSFSISRIKCFDLFQFLFIPRVICFWVTALSFSISLLFKLKTLRGGIIFSRDPVSSFFLSFFHQDICIEVHDAPAPTFSNRILYRRIKYIVVTNSWKRQYIVELFNVDPNKILIAHHGVDVFSFTKTVSQEIARAELKLSNEKKLIVYTGHLFDWKGVYTLARASRFFPDNIECVFIGGTDDDISRFKDCIKRENLKNIIVVGFVPHNMVPIYLSAANVLVLPTSAKYSIGKNESSPLKLFEYMASKKPIIASDLPAIRDIVNEDHVWFTQPDNARELAQTILNALNNPSRTILSAYEKVKEQTWEKRAKKILEFIDRTGND